MHPINRPLKQDPTKQRISGHPRLFRSVVPTTAEKYILDATEISIPPVINTKNIPTTEIPSVEES